MKSFARLLAVASVFASASVASAQQNGVVVQLPTFSFFTVSTTVVVPAVPANVGVMVGAVARAHAGLNEFGGLLPGTRGRASGASSAGMRVSAQVIDLEALDEQVLSLTEPPPAPPPDDPLVLQHRGAGGSSAAQPTRSLAEIRRERAAREATVQEKALDYLQKGEQAQAEGKEGVARIYYQMALRRAEGDVKADVVQRLRALDIEEAARSVADGR